MTDQEWEDEMKRAGIRLQVMRQFRDEEIHQRHMWWLGVFFGLLVIFGIITWLSSI